jgi:hypothetical protein
MDQLRKMILTVQSSSYEDTLDLPRFLDMKRSQTNLSHACSDAISTSTQLRLKQSASQQKSVVYKEVSRKEIAKKQTAKYQEHTRSLPIR